MTKKYFQNLRSKKIWQNFETFSELFSKFQNFHFSNWFFEENFSENFWSRKKFRQLFFSERFFFEKSIWKMKFWNFEKSSEILSNFFPISNFENIFSSWKFNIFHPNFFFWQGMIILHRKITLALSLFDLDKLGTGTGPRTLQIHPDPPSSLIFRERLHM